MNIEQLKKEVKGIETSLNELKKNIGSLSEVDKKKQTEELKNKVEKTKQKINNRITELSEKTDDNSKKELEETKQLLESLENIAELQHEIIEGKNKTDKNDKSGEKELEKTGDEGGKKVGENEGKESDPEKGSENIFGKAWNRTKEQWNDVWDKEKWETEGGKNLLRTAGFVATGVGAIALTVKGIKKLWNWAFGGDEEKNRKAKKKESSWWKKGLAALGIGTAGYLGYKNWDKIKEFGLDLRKKIKGLFEKEKPLELEEAVKSATSEVRNGKIKENPFRQHFEGGITYNEGNKTIESYGEATKVDAENKTIEGLKNIKFPNYEELVHAANIINFARRNFAGKCQSSEPFDISDGGGGDLVVHLANGEKPEWISASDSSLWTKILGAGGCVIGAALGAYVGGVKGAIGLGATLGLGGAAAGNYLDNDSSIGNTSGTVASGTNLKRFKNCLNEQKDENGNSLWPKKSHQEINPDNYSPIEKELNEIIKEIGGTGGEGTGGRNLKSEQNKENPEIFTISSYNQKVEIILRGCTKTGSEHIDYSKITSIKIGKYRKDDRGDGLDIDFSHDKEGLKEAIRVINFTNFIRSNTDFAGNGGENYPFVYGKYKVPFALEMDTNGALGKAVLSHNALKTKFPTIYEDVQKQFCKTDQENLRSQAFNNKNSKGYDSYYIRYLHQMRNEFDSQSYRINGQ